MAKSNTHIDNKRTLYAILASGFLVSLGIGLLSFTLPLISLDAKISGAWLGTGFAGFFLARLLAGPIGGMWADKASPRGLLLVAFGVGLFIPALYFIHPTIITLYGIQFSLGLIAGLVRPVGLAVLGGNAASGSRSHWFALHALAFNLAIFIGPLAGGLLYLDQLIQPVLLGVSLCMGLSACTVFFGIGQGVSTYRATTDDGSSEPDKNDFRALLVAIFGRSVGIGLTIAFYPILLSMTLGRNGLVLGALFSIPSLVVCCGLPFTSRFTKQMPNVNFALGGMVISALGLFAMGLSHDVVHFIVSGVVVGLGTTLSLPTAMAQTSRAAADQGKVFGLTHVVTGVGFVVGPLLGGLLVQSTHAVGFAFELTGLLGLFCCLPLLARHYQTKMNAIFLASAVGLLLIVVCVFRMQANIAVTYEDDGLYRYTEIAMGTVVNLTLVADSSKAADDGARKAMAFIRELQNDLDFRNASGSVGRINSGAGKYFVEPSKRAYGVIRRAVDFSRSTDGIFDPTIGALTTSPLYYVLDETIALRKKGLVDYRLVQFDTEQKRIRLAKVGMALDLGGIAKGTIIDATVKLLRGLGIRAGIVEAGGDFYCFGERDWTVGIQHPRDDNVHGTVAVREQAVCGSGDYQQFVNVEKDGETTLRHHIINPADMEPAAKSTGVTVIAESAELADAMATALFIMGPHKGRVFVHEKFPDVAATWFSPDLTMTTTNNFPQ
ncbi:MAG: MFS transporter [Pseudodesulfovibrio sp.]